LSNVVIFLIAADNAKADWFGEQQRQSVAERCLRNYVFAHNTNADSFGGE